MPNVRYIQASNIVPKAARWLWPGFIPSGLLTLLAGSAGEGKSAISMDIAAAVSAGGVLPTGEKAEKGRVIICNPEDDAACIIVPRLMAASANMANVSFPNTVDERRFDIEDVHVVEATVAKFFGTDNPVRLLIIDPITSVASGTSGRAVRGAMERLARMAQRYDFAILGITHFSKGSSRKALPERVIGSQAYGAVARMVLATIPAKENGNLKNLLVKVKSNVASTSGFLPYEVQQIDLEGGFVASAVQWGEMSSAAYSEDELDEEESALTTAREFLRQALAQGPRAMRELEEEMQFFGFSMKTLRRAKDADGVKTRKEGSCWVWFMPDTEEKKLVMQGTEP